jgi:peptidyl-dipeptidase Dcp
MRKLFLFIMLLNLCIVSCSQVVKNDNALLAKWDTPFGVPPFGKFSIADYLPAFEEGIKLHNEELNGIAESREKPSFSNTIEALDRSGALLTRVKNVFNSMTESMTNDEMQALAKKVQPMLTRHENEITLNASLFKRVKELYTKKDKLDLNSEQDILLDKYYKKFIRGGANLKKKDKEKFKAINEELSTLSVQFGENVLKETNKFELLLDSEKDLTGLPESVCNMGAEDAKAKGYDGKWLYTIQRTSMYPFLTYSSRRDLREQLYKAYTMKGDNNDELDNKKILSRMAALRVKRARLLGYPTHAHYVLEENMAKKPEAVFELLDQLWTPALQVAKAERTDMQDIVDAEGGNFKVQGWDWWYYAEKVRKAKYDLDEEEIRPYFEVKNVIQGVFDLSTDLWGITFEERTDLPKYHADVKTFEVKDKDGSHLAILYTDYFPRASKRGGAWMDVFTKQHKIDGKSIYPVVYNVGNFAKPTGDKPALLSLDNVNTLFHEFGHALHGMLSDCTYESISGTSTPRDFVEFPSQVMENWCMYPDVLKKYAFHYESGDPIPEALITKIRNAGKFNQGFATVEYLAASYLDMYWHTLETTKKQDATTFEKKVLEDLGLIPEIASRYRSTYFNHIFSGGYSAGYYSYIWSEVLDADTFAAFIESGDVYDPTLASNYRKYILSKGGTEDPMVLFKKFRGQEPGIDALLEKRGLN